MKVSAFLRVASTGLAGFLVVAAAGGVTGYAWYQANKSTETFRRDALVRAQDTARGLAASYTEQINRQILAFDQSLDTMARAVDSDPGSFNLEEARKRATALNGLARDIFITDETGVIRQTTVAEFAGRSAADMEVFRVAAERANDKPVLVIGQASVNPIMRQWHLDMVRTLHHADGSFAGIIDADYRVNAITALFQAAVPPEESFVALTGLIDGKLRASIGPRVVNPTASIAETPMFAAVDAADSGVWTGPSAADAVVRIHAFRHIPGRDLAVIAGVSQAEALRPVELWAFQARAMAGAISGLSAVIAILIFGSMIGAGRRARRARIAQTNLSSASALAEVSRAQMEVAVRRLSATLAAVADGLAIFDAHLNLVEWNGAFPERAGINASFVRAGLAMEDILRMQAEAGAFGPDVEVDAEVERRAALMRAGNFGTSLSFQSGARFIELRCRPLSEGGFVALYTDVTEGREARQRMQDLRGTLSRERGSRARLLAAITHELRERAAGLTRAIERLRGIELPPAVAGAVTRVERGTSSILTLADEAADLPRMEADAVVVEPSLVAVESLLRTAVNEFQSIAGDRGLTVYLVNDPSAPAEVVVDQARLRQIAHLLLSEAARYADQETMWLIADAGAPEEQGHVALRVMVRCYGTLLTAEQRAALFPPFDQIAPPESATTWLRGTGLERAIIAHLARLMGGEARCESWATAAGQTGIDLVVTWPLSALPARLGRAPGDTDADTDAAPAAEPSPRTRVLTAGAQTGLRMAAMTLLRREGHLVHTAANGREVIEAMRTTPYDIVFLDAALPDMTLTAAADRIREMIGPSRTLPLIALAGEHDATDERSWRTAGIDDILADPPSLSDLLGAIHKHVWQSAGTTGTEPVAVEEEMEEGIPILSAERISELRANIQAAELASMVEECIIDLQYRLTPLRRALASASIGTIQTEAHAMVGVAAGYGMQVVAARLRAIILAAKEARLYTIDGAADVVEADLARAAAALRRVLALPVRVQDRAV